jgi:hypothetical protein
LCKHQHRLKKISAIEKSEASKSTSLLNPKNPTGMAKPTSPTPLFEPQKLRHLEAGDARFDETDLDCSPSELVANISPYSDRQAAKWDSKGAVCRCQRGVKQSKGYITGGSAVASTPADWYQLISMPSSRLQGPRKRTYQSLQRGRRN